MSPKAADPAVRTALLENAARLLATEGAAGLTLRRLAEATGTSTMAVYTHFGGMQYLRDEVRREGFARLRVHLETVAPTTDPVADLARLGQEYRANATENPHLYRAMFMDLPQPGEDDIGLDTFDLLATCVVRCQAAGRFSPGEPVSLALQLWSAAHGVVALQLAGLLADDLALVTLESSWRNLCRAFGDEPAPDVGRASLGRFDPGRRAPR
jgi:AcrR family transcriptional regulator